MKQKGFSFETKSTEIVIIYEDSAETSFNISHYQSDAMFSLIIYSIVGKRRLGMVGLIQF